MCVVVYECVCNVDFKNVGSCLLNMNLCRLKYHSICRYLSIHTYNIHMRVYLFVFSYVYVYACVYVQIILNAFHA